MESFVDWSQTIIGCVLIFTPDQFIYPLISPLRDIVGPEILLPEMQAHISNAKKTGRWLLQVGDSHSIPVFLKMNALIRLCIDFLAEASNERI